MPTVRPNSSRFVLSWQQLAKVRPHKDMISVDEEDEYHADHQEVTINKLVFVRASTTSRPATTTTIRMADMITVTGTTELAVTAPTNSRMPVIEMSPHPSASAHTHNPPVAFATTTSNRPLDNQTASSFVLTSTESTLSPNSTRITISVTTAAATAATAASEHNKTRTQKPTNQQRRRHPTKVPAVRRPTPETSVIIALNAIVEQSRQSTVAPEPSTTVKPKYSAERDCGVRHITEASQDDYVSLQRRRHKRRRGARIVGGRDSQWGEFPWSVLIRETSLLGLFVKTKCGGVLIDPKWVLTAAHCQPGMFGSLSVVVGESELNMVASGGSGGTTTRPKAGSQQPQSLVRKVKRMIVHRDYNPNNFDNDIALLELEYPYQIEPHVTPICLPEKQESFEGQQALVAGWGKLSFGGPVPNVLQVAKLPVIGHKQCQEMYHNSGHMKIISDSFLCAGYANGGQDSCEGDSGGPLQVQRADGRWTLVGTVSHGIKCAEPNLPGIYIRTAAYLPWIKGVTYHQDTNKRYGYKRRHN